MLKSIVAFINYWYYRYLLVTELYMVEKWERVMIHIVFAIIFAILSLFNTKVVLSLVSHTTETIWMGDHLHELSLDTKQIGL